MTPSKESQNVRETGRGSPPLRDDAARESPFQPVSLTPPVCQRCDRPASIGPFRFNGGHWYLCGACALLEGPVLA